MAAVARVISSSSAVFAAQHHPSASPALKHCQPPQHLVPRIVIHRDGFVHRPYLRKRADVAFSFQAKTSASMGDAFHFDDSHAAGRYGDTWCATASSGSAVAQRSAEGDVMGLLLSQRIVFLGYEMNDFVADATVGQLLLLDAKDSNKDIRLFINCPGGSMSAAMAIFDAIQLCRSDVSTIAFGLAASTASIVLAGGTRGKRLSMPNARIMVHQPMGGASGQALDVEIQAKEIMHHKANCLKILSEITGRPIEKVEKEIDRDRYMSPSEAVEYGLIDGVIDKDSIIPLAPIPEKVSRRSDLKNAEIDPHKFLTPVVPDDEIY